MVWLWATHSPLAPYTHTPPAGGPAASAARPLSPRGHPQWPPCPPAPPAGIPTIFWDHVFEWGEPLRQEITALAQLRQRVGLHSESKLEILAAEPDMYVARVAEK